LRTDHWYRALGLALVIAGTASPLCAQDPRLSARLPGALAPEVQRLADSAAALGLPTEPLVLKALEGESKGADSARIMSAVRQLAGRLAIGRRELGAGSTEPELVAAAAALKAGAAPSTLRALRGLRRDRPLVVPLSVLADLLGAGIPAGEAWSSIEEIAASGGTDAAFLQLRDRLAGKASAPGLPPKPERAPLPGSDPGNSRP
jgi:hypothetical protein